MPPGRGKKTGGAPSQRGRGGPSMRPDPPRDGTPSAVKGSTRWGKSETMGTAKSMMDNNRQQQRRTANDEFLGPPPQGSNLIQTRLVIPGKDMLPVGLDVPGALDELRRAHSAYITFPEQNVLDIRCKTISQMKDAVHAVNWAIHDMRLASDDPPMKFFAQEPTKSNVGDLVSVKIGARPHFDSHLPTPSSNSTALDKHLHRLSTEMAASAETLMGLNKQLKMRVVFGHVHIKQRNTRGRDDITYNEFVKLIGIYSTRGGASLQSRLPEAAQAEKVIRHLIDPKQGICNGVGDLMRGCEITLTIQGQEIKTDSMEPFHQKTQLSMVRAMVPDVWARLNWTVAAPDMRYDWGLNVNTWDDVDIPPHFKDISKKLKLSDDERWGGILKVPNVNTSGLGDLQNEVGETRLKSSVLIPYKTTPYIIEVSVTKKWIKAQTREQPETTWGVELYASHWDESINYVCGGERRKDWGQGLNQMWPGDEPGLEARFEGFLQTILEVQALLEHVPSDKAHEGGLAEAESSGPSLI